MQRHLKTQSQDVQLFRPTAQTTLYPPPLLANLNGEQPGWLQN
jgi:hypothetical protein